MAKAGLIIVSNLFSVLSSVNNSILSVTQVSSSASQLALSWPPLNDAARAI